MGTNDIDPQVFGGMVENVKTLLINQAQYRMEQREANGMLFAKIDNLQTEGCAIGRMHSQDVISLSGRVKELEEAPARLVAIGSMILTALAIIGGFIVWLHAKITGG